MRTHALVPEAAPRGVSALLAGRRRILVTGGAGFNCCAEAKGYASDLSSIEALPQAAERQTLLLVDLTDAAATAEPVRQAAGSIEGPAYGSTSSPDCVYIDSNVTGTFHLLQAVRSHWEALPAERANGFRFLHISTDEVFGSLGETGCFSETTPYAPRWAATPAASGARAACTATIR